MMTTTWKDKSKKELQTYFPYEHQCRNSKFLQTESENTSKNHPP